MGDHDQASEVPEGQKSREVLEGFRKNRNELLRKIPKIDRLMEMESVKAQCELYGYQIVLEAARKAQEQLRETLRTGRYTELRLEEDCRENCGGECSAERKNPTVQRQKAPDHTEIFTAYLLKKVQEILFRQDQRRMQRVINATGVILHTNLGRAPLGEKLAEEIMPLMTGYTNLEMNLEDGKRGSRYDHFSENLCRLTGAEACLDNHGNGNGRKLYEKLEEILTKQGVTNVNACIAYTEHEDKHLHNDSVCFHKKLGYKTVGIFHKCAYKFDKWYDMIWMEKFIAGHSANPNDIIPYPMLNC